MRLHRQPHRLAVGPPHDRPSAGRRFVKHKPNAEAHTRRPSTSKTRKIIATAL
ncbi:hypothetical protein ACFW03_29260 [Peribacillus butanolivorans]|uniref:hypothetical protein n=1 Tax=Peribacillus butanolivorans TaxID=421767 RepID=UPI0036B21A83